MDRIQILLPGMGGGRTRHSNDPAYRLDEESAHRQALQDSVPLMAYMVKRPGGLAIQTFSREELAARAARGEIKRNWLVRTDAGGKWERMDEVFEAEWPAQFIPKTEEAVATERSVHLGSETSSEQAPPIRSDVAGPLPAQTRWTKAAMKRYRDAYTVAVFIVTVGTAVKILGIAGGVILVLTGLAGAGQRGPEAVFGIVAIVLGVIVAAVFFIWGIIISARGQELQAELDVAVYESPFLTDAERATVMSL